MHARFTWQGQDMTPAAQRERHYDAAGRSVLPLILDRRMSDPRCSMAVGGLCWPRQLSEVASARRPLGQ